MKRTLPLLLALSLPAAAHAADKVCVAVDAAALAAPGATEPLGSLDSHRCYAVQERFEDRVRIWVNEPGGFKGAVEISNKVLARVLVDDVPLRDEPGAEPWGMVLAGTGLVVDRDLGDGNLQVNSLDGRVALNFVVETADTFVATSWPATDPDEDLPKDWPTASEPLPPAPAMLFSGSTGGDLRVKVDRPLFFVDEVLGDPNLGLLRYDRVEDADFGSRVRIVGRNFHGEGWVSESAWRKEAPEAGWLPLDGAPQAESFSWPEREVGPKDAPLALEPKGDAVGALLPGARVTVLAEDRGQAQVRAVWRGGEVTGWIPARRLVKEGQESPTPLVAARPLAAVSVEAIEARWAVPQDHLLDPPQDEVPAAAEEPPTSAEPTQAAAEEVEPETVDTEVDLRLVHRALVARIAELRRLYALNTAGKGAAKAQELVVRFVIPPEGVVTEVSVEEEATMTDPAVQALVGELPLALEFPERELPRLRRGEEPKDWNIVVRAKVAFSPTAR